MVAVNAPAKPSLRLTLTLPALTHAANIYFIVTGANKAQALHRALTGSPDPKNYPVSGVRLTQGTVRGKLAAERVRFGTIRPLRRWRIS